MEADPYSLPHLQIIWILGTNATFAAAALLRHVFYPPLFTTMLMKSLCLNIFHGGHPKPEHPKLSLSLPLISNLSC